MMEKAATGPDEGKGSSELLPVVFIVPKILFPSTLEALCSGEIQLFLLSGKVLLTLRENDILLIT